MINISFDKLGIHNTVACLFALIYFCLAYFIVGLRSDHTTFGILVVMCLLLHRYTQKIAYGLVFFILFWIIYDAMRAFPNYLFNQVSTSQIYQFEKSIFGIHYNEDLLTPNEYFKSKHSSTLDLLSGFFYLLWVPFPLTLALYFLLRDKHELLRYSFVFLFINILGFIGYYLYPAAPPWYFALYGEEVIHQTGGSAAGLLGFDSIIKYPLFEKMYVKNANVFAAVPSLHAAYPLIASYFSVKYRLLFFSLIGILVTLGIWFAALYTSHHYLVDICLGIIITIIGLIIWEFYIKNSKLDQRLKKFGSFIDSI
jgi:hypothetical protein